MGWSCLLTAAPRLFEIAPKRPRPARLDGALATPQSVFWRGRDQLRGSLCRPRLRNDVVCRVCKYRRSGNGAEIPVDGGTNQVQTLLAASSSRGPALEIPMNPSKHSELIRFARVHVGSTVIDVWPGNGDWTRLFSDIVGPEGRVYGFVPAEIAHLKNDPVGRVRALAREPGRENVEVMSADLVVLPESSQPPDVVWLHLFYHDLHTALLQTRGASAAAFNRAVYERLKPGGFYVIVDHVAAAGTGTSHAESLHRIEPAAVREEVETAGFVLDAESTVLVNKGDPHSVKVFDPSIKGETDRFAYRFVKL
jgi:predicted methyltransferase